MIYEHDFPRLDQTPFIFKALLVLNKAIFHKLKIRF
jgi:hypothetical protein